MSDQKILKISVKKHESQKLKKLKKLKISGPGLTTWFLKGVGQMTMFDHDGGRGVKISENLTTWYMDGPKPRNF